MRNRWARGVILFFAAALVLLALRVPGWLRSLELTPSAWTAAFWFALLALVIIWLAWIAYCRVFTGPHEVAQFAQGLGAVVTIVAIFVAAGIYFLERRDKPRLSPTLSLNAVRLPRPPDAGAQALLVVRLGIKNEGDRQVEIGCSSLALYGVRSGDKVVRETRESEELRFGDVAAPINYKPNEPCNTAEEARRKWPASTVRPLYRWSLPLRLEPDEADHRYFEMPVDCGYGLLRVLAKLRINPEDEFGYEVKDTISISQVCAGDSEIATGIADAQTRREAADADGSAPSPAAGNGM